MVIFNSYVKLPWFYVLIFCTGSALQRKIVSCWERMTWGPDDLPLMFSLSPEKYTTSEKTVWRWASIQGNVIFFRNAINLAPTILGEPHVHHQTWTLSTWLILIMIPYLGTKYDQRTSETIFLIIAQYTYTCMFIYIYMINYAELTLLYILPYTYIYSYHIYNVYIYIHATYKIS